MWLWKLDVTVRCIRSTALNILRVIDGCIGCRNRFRGSFNCTYSVITSNTHISKAVLSIADSHPSMIATRSTCANQQARDCPAKVICPCILVYSTTLLLTPGPLEDGTKVIPSAIPLVYNPLFSHSVIDSLTQTFPQKVPHRHHHSHPA